MTSTNPVAIVTGASKGIGKAACINLAKLGYNVVGFARSEPELISVGKDCEAANPNTQYAYFSGDVSNNGDCDSIVELAIKKFGRIDALVNNAAILDPIGDLSRISKADFARHFDINLFSILYLTQITLPELIKSKGKVINISSGSATSFLKSWGTYCCSKAALNMMTTGFAAEVPEVTFLALRPGVVDTNMQTQVRSAGHVMKPEDHQKFVSFKENGVLLDPNTPGSIIANMYNETDFEPLSDETLFKMVVMLPTVFTSIMIPARIPEIYHKMKNKLYPDYLYYSLLALGNSAIKGIRTVEEKDRDLLYIQKSISLLKLKTDINTPYYLWACVIILNYFSTVVNSSLNESALILARLSVRISKIYQIDLSKIAKVKYSEEELEFRRRLFWTFYAFDRGNNLFSGSLPTIQDQDIVVNLPINDFWWRYGGECKVEHPEIIFWNHIANSENNEQYSKGDTKNYVKMRTLSGKISDFSKRRWLKKVYNPDDDNCLLVKLIDKLDKFEETIVKTPPIDFDLIKEACSKYKDTIRFTMDIEHLLYKYTFTQFHLYMKSTLYQTEMVRVEGVHMHPGRIVSAKNILIDTAKKQIDLIYELSNVLSPEYWKTKTITTGLISAITCFNYTSTSPKDNLDITKILENFKEVYHKLSNYSEIPVIFLMYLDRLSKFINEIHKENEKCKPLFENMKKYSINESDVNPWLVPKYGALFFLTCCFEGSFSVMKITDYLYIKDTLSAFVNEYRKSKSSSNPNVEQIKPSNTFGRKSGALPGESSSLRNNNSESSYKSNYDQYIKYSKLLEESSPNSTQNYYYQYMVDVLSDAIVQDIISNPVNNQSNFEPQFIFPTVNLDSSHSRADGKKNENTSQYDWEEFDKLFWS
ncbi:hypothetical protein BB558_003221 [Smittium angustum]|uniref:Xylanolytic transcriptional activator regulatory domain-containing protein n=1 Tax=Smittium angustum TaxID=133377 RepID=A0A2U1J6T0_SMIAN|nr:hypothetical protein BB558_003221 [Smittium angustum]